MVERVLLGLALITLLISPLLISYGQTASVDALWWVGLALIVVASSIPVLGRYAFGEPEESGG